MEDGTGSTAVTARLGQLMLKLACRSEGNGGVLYGLSMSGNNGQKSSLELPAPEPGLAGSVCCLGFNFVMRQKSFIPDVRPSNVESSSVCGFEGGLGS